MSKQDAIKEKLKEAKEIKQLNDDDLEKVTGGTGEGGLEIDDPTGFRGFFGVFLSLN